MNPLACLLRTDKKRGQQRDWKMIAEQTFMMKVTLSIMQIVQTWNPFK